MKRILKGIAMGITFGVIAVLSWQMIVMRGNLQEKIEMVNLLISRYEAKAQFIDEYLPVVNEYTGSAIRSKRILAAVYENSLQYDLSPELILSVIRAICTSGEPISEGLILLALIIFDFSS